MSRFKHAPAIALAIVALVAALGGGAYAATTIPDGSVTHPKLAHNSVWHDDLGKGAVRANNLSRPVLAELDSHRGNGAQGATGPQGPKGDAGATGAQGPAGPRGPNGVDSPLVYTFSGASGPDSGDCGNSWATDTYDATFIVEPQVDGSFTITKIVKGTFVTIAGTSEPNPSPCPGVSQTGGVTGTFYGTESWTVPSPGGARSADFDPYASCGAACSPTTSNTSSNDAQDQAFETAFFPGATYNGVTNYDFVYHTASNGNWVDSNTPDNNQGNISG